MKYGDAILERPTAAITKFDAELEELTEDMFASMYAAQGVGLAAPQIREKSSYHGSGRDGGEKSGSENRAGRIRK